MLASSHAPGYAWTTRELIELFQRRPEWVSISINQALAEDADARWAWVVDRYLDQQISLSTTVSAFREWAVAIHGCGATHSPLPACCPAVNGLQSSADDADARR